MPCRQHRLIDFITQHRRRLALLAAATLLAACASTAPNTTACHKAITACRPHRPMRCCKWC